MRDRRDAAADSAVPLAGRRFRGKPRTDRPARPILCVGRWGPDQGLGLRPLRQTPALVAAERANAPQAGGETMRVASRSVSRSPEEVRRLITDMVRFVTLAQMPFQPKRSFKA